MKWPVRGLLARLRAVASTAFPSLRVIGMAYTGLIGVGAAALVVSVAFLPVPPVLQQATQPARDAVANLVQPATDVVTSLIGTLPVPLEPRFLFTPRPPEVAVASPPTIVETVPEDAAPPIVNAPRTAAVARAPGVTLAPVAKADVSRNADAEASAPVAEDVPAEPDQAVEARDRTPVREVSTVALGDTPTVQQEASVEAPRQLAPVPGPTTEAAWQTKARLDVENQAAIDAAKALIVRRKADADTANQAAIDVLKNAAVNATAAATPIAPADAARPAVVVTPTIELAAPVAPAGPQTRISAGVDSNQTLIDAARASKLRARADANAANQAAIDAAKAPRSTVTPVPSPALQRVPSTPTLAPTPIVDPSPTSAASAEPKVADVVNDDALGDQPSDLEEMPITLALDKSTDVAR
ncbi:MAG TPA: hypothetical protein VKV73_24910 [Chloroflexota bacterium]|nr:hypothetical protein [Chloroflexota bacterium]